MLTSSTNLLLLSGVGKHRCCFSCYSGPTSTGQDERNKMKQKMVERNGNGLQSRYRLSVVPEQSPMLIAMYPVQVRHGSAAALCTVPSLR